MIKSKLPKLNTNSLVDRFAKIAIGQDRALLYSELAEYNRLYKEMRAIEDELKGRLGDQRRALLTLYSHDNAQVRLQAAGATLAVEPSAARELIEAIASSRKHPQAGYAGMNS